MWKRIGRGCIDILPGFLYVLLISLIATLHMAKVNDWDFGTTVSHTYIAWIATLVLISPIVGFRMWRRCQSGRAFRILRERWVQQDSR